MQIYSGSIFTRNEATKNQIVQRISLAPTTAIQYTRAMVSEKKECRLCKGTSLQTFLDLGMQPPANAFLKKEDFEKETFYPLAVARCTLPACGFVQLAHVVDPETLFADYVYVSSTSPVFVKHFEDYASAMHARLNLKDALTLDIGSNDGVLVKPLKALGAKALGIDPATKIAEKATSEGIETIAGFFSETFANSLAEKRGRAKLITANNVFAHIDDLDEVMRGVHALLSIDGLFVIEAPYLLDFLEKKLFDTVYHEHLSYLAIRPLQAFFERFEMRIVDVVHVDTHGGSVEIMVAHKDSAFVVSPVVNAMIDTEVEKGLNSAAVYETFAKEVLANKSALTKMLSDLKHAGKKIAGYGAPAKGNTLLNFMQIGPETLDYIVDDSPLKQGLFTPGTHIPVVSSGIILETPPDYLFILAWNFAESIMKKNETFREGGGKFIIPVPNPSIVS